MLLFNNNNIKRPEIKWKAAVCLFFFFIQIPSVGAVMLHHFRSPFMLLAVHVSSTGKQIWEMTCQSVTPILVIACAPKHLKTSSGYLLTYIYLFITGYVLSILALNTMKIIFILLWLVTYGFPVTYESVFFTTLVKIWITRMVCFCFQASREAFSWYHRHLILAVIKMSFTEKDL